MDDDDEPVVRTIAELVSDLLFAGKTLKEIAGYDDVQMAYVLGRHRDEHGRIKRLDGLPLDVHVDSFGQRVVKNRVPFTRMLRDVWERRGKSREEVEANVKDYLTKNPKLGRSE